MIALQEPFLDRPATPRAPLPPVLLRVLLHAGFLVIAIACLALFEHFQVAGNSTASIACLVAAAAFGFTPVRDVLRVVFRVEGKALHLVRALGGLGLLALPLTGVVAGGPVLTRASAMTGP